MSEGMLWISFSVAQASAAVSVGCIPCPMGFFTFRSTKDFAYALCCSHS